MRLAFGLLTHLYLSFVLAEASFLPPSIAEAALSLRERGRRPKKKPVVEHLEDGAYPKYFHEPDGSQALHHYDARYHHATLGHDDRVDTQIHLIRAYLEFFRENQMETWLAHGTLLGWWWNAKMLPWDWDIDTQVSIATILYLAENHNATKYSYTSKTDTEFDPSTSKQKPISRTYHLDINPAAYTRHRNEGDNIIDARWIDVHNGLYIDVTAVAESYPKQYPGIWTCKNYHRYKTRDLWPMRESYFEGVIAKVPYAYSKILSEEYGAVALVVDEYQGHRWSAKDHIWIKKTPNEIQQERLDRKATRRKQQEAKAEKIKEENEREAMKLSIHDQEERERERTEQEEGSREVNEAAKANIPQKEVPSKDRAKERRAIISEDLK